MEQELQRIIVFDTTLRDGEQSPGASMTPGEKLLMARQLARLGVDVIEAGFPVASESDFRAVRLIASEVREAQVAAIARATPRDIDRAWEALGGAANPRIHIFISSSDIHLEHQLRKSRDEVLREACAAVDHARAYTENVEFSAMDATRSDKGFLRLMLEGAIAAGAATVNIADTVGYAVPEEFGRLVAYLLGSVADIDRVVLSVHCHDDLGLATANSLAAVRSGARQVKCTINGIGERAGNAALEEVVMALETRRDLFGLRTGVKSEHLYETSRLLTSITGIGVQPNKAIVGANAFAHASGIHQDGLIKRKETYEIMTPRSVGRGETRLILGRHSGSHAVRDRLLKMGYVLTGEEADRMCARIKELAGASRKEVMDEDLEIILHRDVLGAGGAYKLDCLAMETCAPSPARATVELSIHGRIERGTGSGPEPADALFAALDNATGTAYPLSGYGVETAPEGTGRWAEATLSLSFEGRAVAGRGSHADPMVASAYAYLEALSLITSIRGRLSMGDLENRHGPGGRQEAPEPLPGAHCEGGETAPCPAVPPICRQTG